ncbi:PA0069 family radical SAM protein [Opitutus sp. ER46]|uniref:PA0069 family radical SAM protein n=1 Tax=Opitutus sp. ER46 TaxID=2161864 RepID=UPI000D2F4B5E|nr:PA0069 family radical SAM protein [Opitutus sp. ER46]PTX98473.1 radical SAM protein [Opitutus sp. ER46]
MHTPDQSPAPPHSAWPTGRGSNFNPPNRFERLHVEPDPDCPPDEQLNPRTQFFYDATESVLARNESPDVGFAYGLNPYRGCEHGCAYCYARPYHEYLGWSSGLDFESKILVKLRAPELLRRELSAPRWQAQTIAMSGVTDCYQPVERRFRLTRQCLEVCAELRHPVVLITKNALITRDIDVLSELARFNCVSVNLSVTTLDPELGGLMEPRASRPAARLDAIRQLSAAGIPVGVMTAPVVPGLTDHEVPGILETAAAAGARRAGYVLLRLPHSVKDVFTAWLAEKLPTKQARVLDRMRAFRGGRLYDSAWGQRGIGRGVFADQLAQMFDVTCRRVGLSQESTPLSTEHFRKPGEQLSLF